MTGGMFLRSGFFDERGRAGREELVKVHNQKIMMNYWTLQHNVCTDRLCTGCGQCRKQNRGQWQMLEFHEVEMFSVDHHKIFIYIFCVVWQKTTAVYE